MRIAMTLAVLALFVFAVPGHATVILDFGTGDAGAGGTITVTGSNASGTGILIDSLTVLGAGANDGVYDVNGTVNGNGELGVGSLQFDTKTDTLTITGSISCGGLLAPTPACTAAQIASDATIVASTTLLMATGTFTNVSVAANSPVPGAVSVSFAVPDLKAAALLAVLGIPPTSGFVAGGFSLGGNRNGNKFTAISTDFQNTQVPEPGPLSLLAIGIGLLALGTCFRKKLARV